jgi:hypothetical protein
MAAVATKTLWVMHHLRYVLFGLECMFGIALKLEQVEELFDDSNAKRRLSKEYRFHDSDGLRITGKVSEDENEEGCECVTLCVEGRENFQPTLDRLVQRAFQYERRTYWRGGDIPF